MLLRAFSLRSASPDPSQISTCAQFPYVNTTLIHGSCISPSATKLSTGPSCLNSFVLAVEYDLHTFCSPGTLLRRSPTISLLSIFYHFACYGNIFPPASVFLPCIPIPTGSLDKRSSQEYSFRAIFLFLSSITVSTIYTIRICSVYSWHCNTSILICLRRNRLYFLPEHKQRICPFVAPSTFPYLPDTTTINFVVCSLPRNLQPGTLQAITSYHSSFSCFRTWPSFIDDIATTFESD